MVKKEKRRLTVWTLALAMLLNIFFPLGTAYAADAEDATGKLVDVTSEISQNGVEIPGEGTLTSQAPVAVEVSFRVPVPGDMANDETLTEEHCVHKGDTAIFELSNAFQLVSKSGEKINLTTDKGLLVGHVSFSTNSETKMVKAKVVFDGKDEAFDDGSSEVICKFNADLQYDASGAPADGEEKNVQILDKTFTLKVPPVEKTYTVKKDGKVNSADKTIDWTVTLSGKQGENALDLAGYQFSDDLSDVGKYVEDSFQVNGKDAAPDLSGDVLSYSFPEKTSGLQTVTFQTKISDEIYYGTGTQKIANTAQLLDKEASLVGEAEKEVPFTPTWITKKGEASDKGSDGAYDPKGRTITWTITANQMEASLEGVVITDKLPEGLTFQSANWKEWDGTKWGEEQKLDKEPENGEYSLGNIDSQILLTIVTKVPDEEYATGSHTYTNSASICWDGPTGKGSAETGNINVSIGYNAITKKGTADYEKEDGKKEGKVTWTVGVDLRKQGVPTPKVYDLLVYGKSIDLSKVTGIPDGIKKDGLTPQYNQKYIDETFQSENTNVELNQVYKIQTQDGTPVADLLEVTGFTEDTPASFTFDTQILDPDIYAGNKQTSVHNTASLFSENAKLNAATADVNYASHMLAKEMLKRGAVPDTAESVNGGKTANVGEGFDYQDKSVIFRLSVNADGMDLVNMKNADGTALGAATLTDTLPEGWEFTKFSSGKDCLIFNGDKGDNSSVTATGSLLDSVSNFKAEFEGGTASFTFSELKTPYVILVKARPTDKTAAGYFDSNKTATVTNKLSLKTEHWTPGVSTSQKVSITSQILDKTVPSNATDGALTWTVDYKPYDLDLKGQKLEDTLPTGIDLRTDSKGALLLEDSSGNKNITACAMTLNADGSYTVGDTVPLTAGKNVSYNNASRVLSFAVPNSKKAYRFTYVTDVTGDPGEISNHVSLTASKVTNVNVRTAYSISAADGSASLQRNGWIEVTKKDGEGNPLSGAEFTVLTPDGKTVIRKGTTGAGGTVKIRGIPDGTYLLRETKAPEGYTLDKKTHTLTVASAAASVDGKTGNGANEITVLDFKSGTVGDLTIRKTVAGNAGDKTKAFVFTVTFSGQQNEDSKAYFYVGNGVPDGTIQSGGTVSLADGQSVTITGLPKELSYTVTEADYSAEGYTKQSTGETGVIAADGTQTAAFTNTKTSSHSGGGGGGGGGHEEPSQPGDGTGSLTVRKTVVGQGADLTRKFTFTVVFSGAAGAYPYIGSAVGTLHSGDTVSLANGEYITVQGLPAGAGYTVTESDSTADGYASSSTGAVGVISSGKVSTVLFTNRWSKVPGKTQNNKPPVSGTSAGGSGLREVAAGGKNGMPATGDNRTELAKLGLLVFSASFAALSLASFRYRGKHFVKE